MNRERQRLVDKIIMSIASAFDGSPEQQMEALDLLHALREQPSKRRNKLMTYTDTTATATTAQKRATWRKSNPRELLARIIDENRGASEQSWRDAFWDEVDGNRSLLQVIVQYYLDHNIRSIVSPPVKPPARSKWDRETATKNVKQKLVKRLHEEAQLMFLDLIMPNGKALKECTGQDCRQFGGWATKLAKLVPANKQVGQVLKEGQVRKLWLETVKK